MNPAINSIRTNRGEATPRPQVILPRRDQYPLMPVSPLAQEELPLSSKNGRAVDVNINQFSNSEDPQNRLKSLFGKLNLGVLAVPPDPLAVTDQQVGFEEQGIYPRIHEVKKALSFSDVGVDIAALDNFEIAIKPFLQEYAADEAAIPFSTIANELLESGISEAVVNSMDRWVARRIIEEKIAEIRFASEYEEVIDGIEAKGLVTLHEELASYEVKGFKKALWDRFSAGMGETFTIERPVLETLLNKCVLSIRVSDLYMRDPERKDFLDRDRFRGSISKRLKAEKIFLEKELSVSGFRLLVDRLGLDATDLSKLTGLLVRDKVLRGKIAEAKQIQDLGEPLPESQNTTWAEEQINLFRDNVPNALGYLHDLIRQLDFLPEEERRAREELLPNHYAELALKQVSETGQLINTEELAVAYRFYSEHAPATRELDKVLVPLVKDQVEQAISSGFQGKGLEVVRRLSAISGSLEQACLEVVADNIAAGQIEELERTGRGIYQILDNLLKFNFSKASYEDSQVRGLFANSLRNRLAGLLLDPQELFVEIEEAKNCNFARVGGEISSLMTEAFYYSELNASWLARKGDPSHEGSGLTVEQIGLLYEGSKQDGRYKKIVVGAWHWFLKRIVSELDLTDLDNERKSLLDNKLLSAAEVEDLIYQAQLQEQRRLLIGAISKKLA